MSDPERPFHSVSNSDIWVDIQTMKTMLSTSLAKHDAHDERYHEVEKRVNTHETRLQALDYRFYGILVAVVALVGSVGSELLRLV